jgi:DNA-binding winged helix-turn-helix (wHTH) protein
MLTARGDDTDRIVGLEMGADDYLPKPFNPRELLARIKGMLRRAPRNGRRTGRSARFHFAGWTLDVAARQLIAPDGVLVPLGASEYRLLRVFLEHPQRVLNRDQLLDLTQGREATPFDRSIDVQVSRLRRRLRDDPREAAIIKTVRNEGYCWRPRSAGNFDAPLVAAIPVWPAAAVPDRRLIIAQLLSAAILLQDRDQALYHAIGGHVAQRIAAIVNLLDTLDDGRARRLVTALDLPPTRSASICPGKPASRMSAITPPCSALC